jgi:hypothetical protein
MAKRIGGRLVLMLLHELCVALARHRTKIAAFTGNESGPLIDAVLAACEELTTYLIPFFPDGT